MVEIETSWETSDGSKIFARAWIPNRETRGVICLIHGLGEHSGRYHHVADRLGKAGYPVLAFDLHGHGLSSGKRGHVPSLERLLEDIKYLVHQAQERFPGKPVFLYGHSLGGILALSLILAKKRKFAGIVVTGLALRSALLRQKAKIALAKVLGHAFPAATLSSGLEPAMICSDRSVVDGYICDPLVHDRISFGLGLLILREIDRLFAQAGDLNLPILVMHGKDDQLGFPEGSEVFAERVEGDCTLKIWEGMSHEIHNEPGNNEVFEFMINWLDRRIPLPATYLDKA